MPENPKAESPSTHSTLAPGSYFLIIFVVVIVVDREDRDADVVETSETDLGSWAEV